jgi:hypothetical protein
MSHLSYAHAEVHTAYSLENGLNRAQEKEEESWLCMPAPKPSSSHHEDIQLPNVTMTESSCNRHIGPKTLATKVRKAEFPRPSAAD